MTKPDWEAIELAYRAGLMSLREITSQHNISEGATCTFPGSARYALSTQTKHVRLSQVRLKPYQPVALPR